MNYKMWDTLALGPHTCTTAGTFIRSPFWWWNESNGRNAEIVSSEWYLSSYYGWLKSLMVWKGTVWIWWWCSLSNFSVRLSQNVESVHEALFTSGQTTHSELYTTYHLTMDGLSRARNQCCYLFPTLDVTVREIYSHMYGLHVLTCSPKSLGWNYLVSWLNLNYVVP